MVVAPLNGRGVGMGISSGKRKSTLNHRSRNALHTGGLPYHQHCTGARAPNKHGNPPGIDNLGAVMKVLLIDDHPLILAALQSVIQGLGDHVEVAAASSGATARAMLQADSTFDLVLL